LIIFAIYFLSRELKTARLIPLIKNLFATLSGVILMLAIGCESTVEFDQEASGQAFYPLNTGDYREYQVREINYTILSPPDTVYYFLKEQVGDRFINQAGGMTYMLNRFKRNDDATHWKIDSVWTVIKSETNVVIKENNIPFTKLVFPVLEQKRWDGNAFNTMEEELYTYENTYQPLTLNDLDFNSTLKVIQENNMDSIVMRDERIEIYAENVGLIYKESIILHYCTENECLGKQIIEQGIDFRQELVGYGNE
jgi:hypothetical protein